MFPGGLLSIPQGPVQLCLITHPTLRRLKVRETDPAPNEGQVFTIERKVDSFSYNSAAKAADLP